MIRDLHISVFVRSILCSVAVVAAGTAVAQQHTPAQPATQPASQPALQVTCPVTGKQADRSVRGRFRGRRIFFADLAAKEKFLDEPADFAEAAEKQWQQLPFFRTQIRCPVTGGLYDRKFAADYGDEEIFFATAEAMEQYGNSPDKYRDKLEKNCFTWQTNCLVCNHIIEPDVSILAEGRTIYSACEGCIETIREDKDQYAKRYDEQVRKNQAAFEQWGAKHASPQK